MQRSLAKGERPAPHTDKRIYLSHISYDNLSLIRTVCRDLTRPELLEKCLKGRTQNRNKSLHGKVWRKASKDKVCGLHRTVFVSQVTILEHNFGHSEANLLTSLGFKRSSNFIDSLERKEKRTSRTKNEKRKKKKTRKQASKAAEKTL